MLGKQDRLHHTAARRPVGRATLAVLAAGLVAAGCGGGGGSDDAASSSSTTTTAPTTTTTAPPPVAPLTGLDATAEVLGRPAIVVKVDNADGGGRNTARPQFGLGHADVVYEELVEGSVTRFAAVFHSELPDQVGPVRSGRVTDVEIISALNRPLLAWSGGNSGVVSVMRSAAIVDASWDAASSAYHQASGRPAPHNLVVSLPALIEWAPAEVQPPPPLFTFRPAGSAPGAGEPGPQVDLVFGGGAGAAGVTWHWDGATGTYLRSQKGTTHVTDDGNPIGAHNVVVQFTEYFANGDVDSVGSAVMQARLVGSGTCWFFTGGVRQDCTWSKASAESVIEYRDGAGAPLGFTPGRTWVELVPGGGASVPAAG